jgi:hypothetical protein
MKKTIIAVLALLTIGVGACAEQKKGTKKKKKTTTTTTTTTPPTTTGKVKNSTSIQTINIHRTACYGRCPEYYLTINADGNATYVGRKFSEYPGTYQKRFATDKIQGLFKQAEMYRIDTCGAEYSYVPDIAGLIYTINYTNGREQEIKNASSPFAPKFLRGLAKMIDDTVKIDATWTKTESWEAPKN